MTNKKIAANSITAVKIAAGEINASHLSADAIDGKTITGGTLQTAKTGARTVISPRSGIFGTRPAIQMYSGLAPETEPGALLVTDTGGIILRTPNAGKYPPASLSLGSGTNLSEVRLSTQKGIKVTLSEFFDMIALHVVDKEGTSLQYEFGINELSVGEWQPIDYAPGGPTTTQTKRTAAESPTAECPTAPPSYGASRTYRPASPAAGSARSAPMRTRPAGRRSPSPSPPAATAAAT
ncbi:hypothetical protein ACFQ0M_48120 [Kitasatospora aburaviensis]